MASTFSSFQEDFSPTGTDGAEVVEVTVDWAGALSSGAVDVSFSLVVPLEETAVEDTGVFFSAELDVLAVLGVLLSAELSLAVLVVLVVLVTEFLTAETSSEYSLFAEQPVSIAQTAITEIIFFIILLLHYETQLPLTAAYSSSVLV